MTQKPSTIERMEACLFKDNEEAAKMLTPAEMERKQRLMLVVSRKLANPFLEDSVLAAELMEGFNGATDKIGKSQAYRDLAMARRLVGNITLASKQWYRYMIIEGAKKAYRMAMDKEDAKGAAAALDKIGKYTRCDKDDEGVDFDKMIPPSFEPSDDVTLIEGLQPIENLEERRRELRRLARGEQIEEAEIIVNQETEEEK